MTTIYVVRHAEAEGNVYRRCHGQYDALLTTHAWEQLPFLAERFADVPIDCVYASDLYRARHTAKAIADMHDLPVHVCRILREMDFGEWEDMPWAELPIAQAENYRIWKQELWNFRAPGGEAILESGERLLRGLKALAKRHEGKAIVAACHGTVILAMLVRVLGLKPEQIHEIGWADNTCVSKLEFDGDECRAVYWNDATHLPQEHSTFAATGWKGTKAPTNAQIWFRDVNMSDPADIEALRSFAREFYINAYGSTDKLDEEAWLADTAAMAKTPRAVTFGVLDDKPVALVRLNVCDESEPEIGKVGSFVIDQELRGCGLSPQILGQAISVYRDLGKNWLCAYAAVNNGRAQGFYRKFGFRNMGIYENEFGQHFKMCKPIHVPSVEEESLWFDSSEYNLD